MLPSKHSDTASADRPPVRYYKYESWLPELYVQEKWEWRSYTAGGATAARGRGRIPRGARARLLEIDEAEARRWMPEVFPEPVGPSRSLDDLDLLDIASEGGFLEFEPSRLRYCLVVALGIVPLVAVAVAVSYLAESWQSRFWVFMVIFPMSVLGLRLDDRFRSDFKIRIRDEEIVGPGGRGSRRKERTTISLNLLDRRRSAKRRLIDRLLGRQYLYEMRGSRIYLQRWSFAPETLHRLLEVLGLEAATRRSAHRR